MFMQTLTRIISLIVQGLLMLSAFLGVVMALIFLLAVLFNFQPSFHLLSSNWILNADYARGIPVPVKTSYIIPDSNIAITISDGSTSRNKGKMVSSIYPEFAYTDSLLESIHKTEDSIFMQSPNTTHTGDTIITQFYHYPEHLNNK